MGTTRNPDGAPVTTVTDGRIGTARVQAPQQLQQPMGHLHSSHVPFPDDVLEVCWEEHDDWLCVPRALAVLTQCTLADVCADFDGFLGEWRHRGVTSEELMAWCKDKGLPFHCFAEGAHHTWTPAEPQGRQISWIVHADHGYFYKNRALEKHRAMGEERTCLHGDHESDAPPVGKWQPWVGSSIAHLSPGYFHCADLKAVRRELLESGRSPKVTLKSLGQWGSLRYRCTQARDGASGWCVVKELPRDWEMHQEWAEKLGVDYCGENLPGLSLKAFTTLLKGRRRQPTLKQRKEVLDRQESKCAMCGHEGQLEFDHVPPVRQVMGDSAQHFRALCKPCHQEVTRAQGGSVHLESRFNRRAWDAYVLSPKPPPLVFQPERPGAEDVPNCEIDIVRCRRSALFAPACKSWPVFCSLDSIHEVGTNCPQLGDFNFITGIRDARRSRLSQLPFVGPMWYPRPSAEYLLHTGICGWQDITHTFTGTGRAPSEAFAPILTKMEEAWGDNARRLGLHKDCVNMLVGVMAHDSSEALSVVSGGAADGLNHFARKDFAWGDQCLTDWVYRTTLLDNKSWRPIHDFIMSHEAVCVAQMHAVVRRLQIPCAVLDVKTDALNLLVASKHVATVRQAVEGMTYAKLHLIQREKGQKSLHNGVVLHPRPGDGPVFRFKTEARRLAGHHKTPRRDAPTPASSTGWRDLCEAAAHDAVMGGASLLVTGMPGTGKSHWTAKVCAELETAGKRISVIAKTWASVSNMNAMLLSMGSSLRATTADHWANACVRRGVCEADILVCEEFTQLNSHLWDEVAKAALVVPQVICVGDPYQFGAVADTYCGSPLSIAPENSDLLLQLCGGNRLELTENRRSDPALFGFYNAIPRHFYSNIANLPAFLAAAREQFPLKPGTPRYSLSISHATRMAVNRQANLDAKCFQIGAMYLEAPPSKEDNAPQSFWIWPGQELIGHGGKARKGVFYTVVSVEDRVTLAANGEELSMTPESVVKSCRLSHCITYASCQGLSLDGVRLLNTDSPHFTWRHLYVGASRCTSSAALEVS